LTRQKATLARILHRRRRAGDAEIAEDGSSKRAIVTAHPFAPLAPFRIVHSLALDVFVPVMQRWVTARPIVVIHA